jgi:UTP--glucose-1-phosphate uridylyltransferase
MAVKIRKVVFPVAGFGTRFLPVTKASPKEMLPIVDKPIIQYAVEEAVNAGARELIFVTSPSKKSLEDHFDTNYELEEKLAKSGKTALLSLVQNIIPKGAFCVYIRQHEQLGLGHAVLCAKEIVGNEPFAVILPDDLIDAGKDNCLKQMVKIFEQTGKSILALEKVAREETKKYGIVELQNKSLKSGEKSKLLNIIEKPSSDQAPSLYASIGRYILTPKVFKHLEKTGFGAIGEIQIVDGIKKLAEQEDVFGYLFKGTRYDCGDKFGYLQAIINYGRKHHEVGERFKQYLQTISSC